jgi:hypothetical protein
MSPMEKPLVYLIWTDEEGIQSPFILKADSEENAVLELDRLMGGMVHTACHQLKSLTLTVTS